MKKLNAKSNIIIAFLLAMVILFLSLVIGFFIKNNAVPSVEYPEGFVVISEENSEEYEDYLEILGYSIESFDKYLQNKGIIAFASNNDNSIQFRLTETETEVSKEIGTLHGKGEKELNAIGNALTKEGYRGLVEANGNTYFEILTLNGEENEKYCTLQYLTVKNGKFYSLIYYGSKEEVPANELEMVYETLDSVKIPDTSGVFQNFSEGGTERIVYIVLISIVIIFGIVSVALLSTSLFKDLKIHFTSDREENIKIKRRRKF